MAFATPEDVATRLGRELTAIEAGTAALLLDSATTVIAEAVDQDDDWAAALTPVPGVLRVLCIELATRGLSNPQGLASLQETLGAYSSSVRFRGDEASGLMLTDREERLARRAVVGAATGSARLESQMEDVWDWRYGS